MHKIFKPKLMVATLLDLSLAMYNYLEIICGATIHNIPSLYVELSPCLYFGLF